MQSCKRLKPMESPAVLPKKLVLNDGQPPPAKKHKKSVSLNEYKAQMLQPMGNTGSAMTTLDLMRGGVTFFRGDQETDTESSSLEECFFKKQGVGQI